jgi:hypothetical protein
MPTRPPTSSVAMIATGSSASCGTATDCSSMLEKRNVAPALNVRTSASRSDGYASTVPHEAWSAHPQVRAAAHAPRT